MGRAKKLTRERHLRLIGLRGDAAVVGLVVAVDWPGSWTTRRGCDCDACVLREMGVGFDEDAETSSATAGVGATAAIMYIYEVRF